MSELDATPLEPAGAVRPPHSVQRPDRIRRMVEGDLLPRLLLSNDAGPLPPSFVARAARSSASGNIEELVALARSPASDREFRSHLDAAVENGDTIEAVFADLLAPIARRMGTLWEEDECDFFEVTVVCARIQRAIRRLSSRYAAPAARRSRARVVVSAMKGGQHTLGALTIAESLVRHGFDVQLGDPFVPGVSAEGCDVFALSVTRTTQFEDARDLIEQVRDRAGHEISVIVGGAAFRTDPGLIRKIGADGWAEDAASAIDLVHNLVRPLPRYFEDGSRLGTAATF